MSATQATFRYESNATHADLAARIRAAKRVLVTAHAKPDGDALGSVLALTRALPRIGVAAEAFLLGPFDAGLDLLLGDTTIHRLETERPADDFDLVVVCDTGAFAQLEPLTEWLRERRDRVLGLDHHASGDDVASMRIVDTSKASATQLLVELIDELGVEVDGAEGGIGEALFVGLATDTGWFRFQNADAEAFRVAARLLAAGVDKSRLYQIIEETAPPARLALEARALSSVRYVRNNDVAIMTIGPEDFRDTGATTRELTGIVNHPLQVGSVQVSILLTQFEPGLTKVSFRTKPAIGDTPFTDVNLLAQRFGGGGHAHAAGARIEGDLEEAVQAIIKEL